MADDDAYRPRVHDPDWQKAKQDRAAQGRPKGPHIRETSTGEDALVFDHRIDEIMQILARREAEDGDKDAEVTVPRPHWNMEFSFGNLLTLVAMAAGFIVAYTQFIQTVEALRAQVERNKSSIEDMRLETSDRVKKYVPAIEQLASSLEAQKRASEVQDTRMQNLTNAMQQLRDDSSDKGKMIADLARIVSQTHEDIAVFKAQMGRDKRTELQPSGH